ncbi:MAG TPA: glycoside hydrolase family 3 C-terminal domain-containing protein [Steroidobacteraceae bacterium]
MSVLRGTFAALALSLAAVTAPVLAAGAAQPWLNARLSPDERAALAVKAMTEQEKLTLVFGYFGSVMSRRDPPPPAARMGSAGYVPGIPRLGIPPQWITDAGLGVATQRDSSDAFRERTALPSGLATAASWNPTLAERGGAMIGSEAHASGFDVMLGPGLDLVREPRGGRDFEYAGEDPLLAGTIAAAEIRGIQSQHVIAVMKHFALNDQETGRSVLSADIGEAAARESDLLAFELAVELGHPGAVMCSYNRVNGVYACQNRWLLGEVLDRDWGYSGYVMSDWGAVHSTVDSALAGLDQESAYVFDYEPYYGAALKKALAAGKVPLSRLDDMAERILRSMFAAGVVDHPIGADARIDFAADQRVSQADESQGIVLLKNAAAILPLAHSVRRLLVVGGHADRGVISGGGSSTVFPVGGNAVPGVGPKGWPGPVVYLPSSPLAAMMEQAPQAQIRYESGENIAQAVKAARSADRVVVFATQWEAESEDVRLELDGDQNELIAALAEANPHTVVVLETGGPVLMPWLDKVAGVLEAWYPGSGGGEAIARVLFGAVNPSGHLPVSFPASREQLPNPVLPGTGVPDGRPFAVHYDAGAAAGYKWYEKKGLKPLFSFGYGLSYTRFGYGGLTAHAAPDGGLLVSFTVSNIGRKAGAAAAQVYAGPASGGWEAPRRLAGWRKVELGTGGSRRVSLEIDPRLLASFDAGAQRWKRAAGTYELWLGGSSADLPVSISLRLPAWQHSARWPVKGIDTLPAGLRRAQRDAM